MNHGGVRGFSQQPVQLLLGTDSAETLQLVLTAATSQPGAVLIALSIHRVLMAALFLEVWVAQPNCHGFLSQAFPAKQHQWRGETVLKKENIPDNAH